MPENKPIDKLIKISYQLQELRLQTDPQYDPNSFLVSSISRNVDDATIQKIIDDYEHHIVKYIGEDHTL